MKNLFRSAIAFCAFSIFFGCSTDFNVIAPYKEVIVINGLLDPLDSVHYVRVTKAFLGEGNVYTMASVSDSSNYADILDVKLESWYGGVLQGSTPMTRTTEIDRDSGTFAYPFQILYKTNAVILQDGTEYRIVVKNTQTGETAYSQTKVVRDVHVNSPTANDSIDLVSSYPAPTIVNFDAGTNTAFIDMIIRFHYREIDPNGVSTEKFVDWNFEDKDLSNAVIPYRFYKYNFFQMLGTNIPVKPGFTRRCDSLALAKFPFEYILIGGSEDLQTYIQLNTPTSGVVQDRPLFTTVQNGLGLFTGRVMHSEFRFPNHNTQTSFDTIMYVRDLNFQF
jgi:hypothetical protein